MRLKLLGLVMARAKLDHEAKFCMVANLTINPRQLIEDPNHKRQRLLLMKLKLFYDQV